MTTWTGLRAREGIFELQGPLHARAEANLNDLNLPLGSGARQGHRGDGPAGQARQRDLPREYREVLEESSDRASCARAQLRSRAHEIAVETVEKKSLSPFNDKVHGLDAHNRGRWGTGATWSSCGCWALTLRQALRLSTL